MTVARSIEAYFRVRPGTFPDAIRLFAAYCMAMVLRVAAPARFKSVGLLLAGANNVHVRIDGVEFEVRPRTNDLDIVSPKHEPLTTSWFRARADDIVVDVGAHIGRYSLLAAANGATVVAIEPDPANFRLLERNVKLNQKANVVLIREAITARAHDLILTTAPPSNTGLSAVKEHTGSESGNLLEANQVLVRGRTLDQVVREHRLERIDWLKIDVEGHEIAVLESGAAALEMTRHLILEVTDHTAGKCRRIVESHGFALVSVEDGSPARNWLLTKEEFPVGDGT